MKRIGLGFALFLLSSSFFYSQNENDSKFVIRKPKNQNIAVVSTLMPVFNQVYGTFVSYLRNNITVPDSAAVGSGYFTILIDTGGFVIGANILKGVTNCKQCDDEVLRVLRSLPPFIPGPNQKETVLMHIPVRFGQKQQ